MLQKVDNRTQVLIIQHPRERKHAFNTARLIELCLDNVQVVVDYESRLRRHPEHLPDLRDAALLYPHADARDVTQLAANERPRKLVVLDGTWHQAHTLYRDLKPLQALPHLTLPPSQTSEFQVRLQPSRHCLSSVEAVSLALSALEPQTKGLENLMRAFRRMNERQISVPLTRDRIRVPRRPVAGKRLPRALVEDFDKLVVAYGEVVPLTDERRVLVTWSAERPLEGTRFEAVLRIEGVNSQALAHAMLSPEMLCAGEATETFAARWAAFCRQDDVLATWSPGTLTALRQLSPFPTRSILLKAAYRSVAAERGSLEEVLLHDKRLQREREARVSEARVSEARVSEARVNEGARTRRRLDNAVALAVSLHRRSVS